MHYKLNKFMSTIVRYDRSTESQLEGKIVIHSKNIRVKKPNVSAIKIYLKTKMLSII